MITCHKIRKTTNSRFSSGIGRRVGKEVRRNGGCRGRREQGGGLESQVIPYDGGSSAYRERVGDEIAGMGKGPRAGLVEKSV